MVKLLPAKATTVRLLQATTVKLLQATTVRLLQATMVKLPQATMVKLPQATMVGNEFGMLLGPWSHMRNSERQRRRCW